MSMNGIRLCIAACILVYLSALVALLRGTAPLAIVTTIGAIACIGAAFLAEALVRCGTSTTTPTET